MTSNSVNSLMASTIAPTHVGEAHSLTTRGVAELLRITTTKHPSAVALVFEDKQITYSQLFNRAQSFARALRERGISKGDRVGVLFPNHPDFVAAFFAVIGIGAVVVPINPLLKSDEIAHILSDSAATAIVVHERALEEVLSAAKQTDELKHVFVFGYEKGGLGSRYQARSIFDVKAELTIFQAHPDTGRFSFEQNNPQDNFTNSIDCNRDLVLLVYTSGTTGKPKGAMLNHSNLLTAVGYAQSMLALTEKDRMLAVLPLCHIYGLTVVMLGSVCRAGSVVVMEKFEAKAAVSLIENEKVTVLPAVPTMYQFMMMEIEKEPRDLSNLRLCLSGGAAMPVELFPKLDTILKKNVVEGYGLTEVSCIASLNRVDGVQKRGSVGPALPGVQIAIVDPEGRHLPAGAQNVGEVTISGPNVMQGYWRRKEATEEVLSNGWFKTGDLGYLDADGYLYIVGRTKELIIRGGQNIYPREIENVIMKLPEVQDVAVVGVPDQYMGEKVKACVVLKQGAKLSPDEIKDFCKDQLAEYKVPRLVELRDELPRNSTGKILKRLLVSE